MNPDIELSKELLEFSNANQEAIETKFKRNMEFTEFHENCYETMFNEQRHTSAPLAPKVLKEKVEGLTEAYKKNGNFFIAKRNESIKGLDIQKGQWYEKALQMFLATKGIKVTKKGFPYPDFEVSIDDKVVGYYELKYIKSPFLTANTKIKETYPYQSTRYDYEASLTLDTGQKMEKQRDKSEELITQGFSVYYVWWFDCFHIKGIFAMSAPAVFDYYDHLTGNLLVRKSREGDKDVHQEKGKIYPPLLEMDTFTELIDTFEEHA